MLTDFLMKTLILYQLACPQWRFYVDSLIKKSYDTEIELAFFFFFFFFIIIIIIIIISASIWWLWLKLNFTTTKPCVNILH